eukprot:TRINITY_DN1589_c0_g1_i1.p1 TRINITY_DN1589_c0_g1~~TRINITY_DN1589_c0_g1_i1.p1  ORF type:complete len:469 (+),score=121.21 TRINITY_DN1589_c0_g1_i1:111-1517(+)
MKSTNILLLLALLSLAKGEVAELTFNTFHDFLKSNDLALITFYSKSCPHCSAFEPLFNAAAAQSALLRRPYSFGRVEAEDEAILADQNEIKQMPTVRLFAMGSRVKSDYDRSSKSIMEFLDEYAQALYKSLELFDTEEILSKRNAISPEVIFVGENGREMEVYKGVAETIQGVRFYHVAPKLGTKLFPDIKSHPAIILFKGFDERQVVYTDELDPKKLKDLIEDNRFPRVRQFDHSTVGQIFKTNGMKAVVLFTRSSEELSAMKDVFHAIATERKAKDVYYITANPSVDLGEKVAKAIGIEEGDTPIMVILERKKDMEVYAFAGKLAKTEMETFIDEWRAGKVQRMLKSESIPKDSKSPVKQIVGKTFKKEVADFDGSVLVNFCVPSRKECKDFEEVYSSVAAKASIKVATINPARNEIEDIELPSKYPTLILFKNKEHKLYKGELNADSILYFIETGNDDPSKRTEL